MDERSTRTRATPRSGSRSAPVPPAAPLPGSRIRLSTPTLIRWVAILGQLTTVVVMGPILGFRIPLAPCLAVIAASLLLNLAASAQSRRMRLGEQDAVLYLGYDVVQLTALLFLTGGIINPFSVLMLAPITVSATILSGRATAVLAVLTVAMIGFLAIWSYPLPTREGEGFSLPGIYHFGAWAALSVAAVFIAVYVWRVAHDSRLLGRAYEASQAALAREQQMAAVGGLAAAAAHELGTPLATIAVVARELDRELGGDPEFGDDLRLLREQAERCGAILAELARRPRTGGGAPYEHLTLAGLIEAAAEPHRRKGISLEIPAEAADGSPPPRAWRRPELVHGLGNLLQNAIQFARSGVEARWSWDEREVVLTITDDGPGFPPDVLPHLGDPDLAQRGGQARPAAGRVGGRVGRVVRGGRGARAQGLGLGVFIAVTLLERTGARISFANRSRGGAEVVLVWQKDIFERKGMDANDDDTDA